MFKLIKGLFVEEEGQGMAEYGLILGLIAVVVIVALTALGGKISSLFQNLTNQVPAGAAASTTTSP